MRFDAFTEWNLRLDFLRQSVDGALNSFVGYATQLAMSDYQMKYDFLTWINSILKV